MVKTSVALYYLMGVIVGVELMVLSYYDFKLKLTVMTHLFVFILVGIGLGAVYQVETGDLYWFEYSAFAALAVVLLAGVFVGVGKIGELDVYPLALVGIYLPMAPPSPNAFHLRVVYEAPLFPITVFGNALLLLYVYFTVLRFRWLFENIGSIGERVKDGAKYFVERTPIFLTVAGLDGLLGGNIHYDGVRAFLVLILWGLAAYVFSSPRVGKVWWVNALLAWPPGLWLGYSIVGWHLTVITFLWLNAVLKFVTRDNCWLTTVRSVRELRPFMRLVDVVVRIDDVFVKVSYKNISRILMFLREKQAHGTVEFIAGYPSQVLSFEDIKRLENLVEKGELKDGFKVQLPVPFVPFILLGFVMSIVAGDVISLLVYLASL